MFRVRNRIVQPINNINTNCSRGVLLRTRRVVRNRTLTPRFSATLFPCLIMRFLTNLTTFMYQVTMNTSRLLGRPNHLELFPTLYRSLCLSRGRLLRPRGEPITIILSKTSTTLRSRLSVNM